MTSNPRKFTKLQKEFQLNFNQFVLRFIRDKKSFLTKEDDITFGEDDFKRCWKCFVENPIESGGTFNEKIEIQLKGESYQTKLFFAHVEWLWSSIAADISIRTKRNYAIKYLNREAKINEIERYQTQLNDCFPKGIMTVGMHHKTEKPEEIRFCFFLFEWLRKEFDSTVENIDLENLLDQIENFCLFHKYERNSKDQSGNLHEFYAENCEYWPEKSNSMPNALLHLSKPNQYEDIVSNAHKNRIVSSFLGLFESDDALKNLSVDKKLGAIREKLNDFKELGFYEKKLARIWNPTSSDADFDDLQGLQFKKSIILYGPPGTSKTHTANRLAESLILQDYIKDKANLVDYLGSTDGYEKIIENQITRLQMHTNYNYEDFIAGVHLINSKTEAQKGDLLKLCDGIIDENKKAEVSKNPLKPHVLILDEINRVDLSRLFGEFFSAMENREQTINVSVGRFELTVPKNLYIIGTMNEIDFSLERVDFALRRRFVWYFKGFEETVLNDIILEKIEANNLKSKPDEEILANFIERAKALNLMISTEPELGQEYQIGHTFFAEVIDIYMEVKRSTNRQNSTAFEDAKKILWDISIGPMLEAFLGNMDSEQKKEKQEQFKSKFSLNDKKNTKT